jgi:hypothetical protein
MLIMSTTFMKFVSTAKNSVEVYIRNGGTRSRCSQYYNSNSNNVKEPDETSHMSLHQMQNSSQESTLIQNDSTRMTQHPPNLRRYFFLINTK